jgi:catechol 2,3-dioxygenase-like lactoylglutathione lyase family enzyme
MTEPLKGVHHTAFRCRDAEETRRFYEDLLGLPLKAALVFETEPGTGKPAPYMHLFFELRDGNYVAFFDEPGRASDDKFKMKHGFDCTSPWRRTAWKCSGGLQGQAGRAGVPRWADRHRLCHSIYFYDPNGLNVRSRWRPGTTPSGEESGVRGA